MKKLNMKSLARNTIYAALAGVGLLFANPAQAVTTNIISGQLTGTINWTSNQVYQLNGAAWVMSNAVLNIQEGTVVCGKNLGTGTNNVAALYITQGGKIYAQGTRAHPIIFTAAIDDTTIPDDMPIWGPSARGQWGGLVILGQAPINGAIDTTGNAATPKYEVYEGLPDEVVGGQNVFRFGGTNDNDDSGVIRYVSIRHGGAVLAPNKEINGLSLGAVGRGTTIEYVESYCAADDGFEFFGGTVNTKYLVSSFNDDDSFDTDMGYSGTNQFWFAIQAPDKRNYGMELNSQPNELINSNNAAPILPRGTFQVYNLTIIGSGTASTNLNGGADDGIALRPFASPSIYNAIFTDFNGQGIRLDAQNNLSANNVVSSNYAAINNSLWWGFVTNAGTGSQAVDNSIANLSRGSSTAVTFWNTSSFTNEVSDPLLASISRTNFGGASLDPRPLAGSPAYSNYAVPPAGLASVNYRGAFGTDLWISGWTALAEYGILTTATKVTNIVSGQLTGTNNWYANQVYQLNGAAWVMSNAVLNIEAGTVIAGKNLGTGTNNVAALYITQGAKIYAQGTATNPIIFTAAIDDTTIPDDMPIWGPSARGQWGGLVILGQAPINGAIDTTGNAATPKYEVYEGLPDEVVGGQNVFRFGGTNDNDDSGILRYVSIRHGGAVLAPNKEINGLSLGAVGRGTTIEYVESYCAADDGFEFFGGTVNTKYLVSSFNDDDSFDTDMGYSGTNQFWFAIQAPDKRNYGMELNSQPNELINSNNAAPILPRGTFQVYNLTVIGAGTSSTNLNGGADDGIALRPFASPSIFNAVFTDFNGQGIRLDAQNNLSANNVVNSNYAAINNSLWWGFVTNAGTGSQAVDNSIANLSRGSSTAATFWNTGSFTNEVSNPLLVSVSRTNDGVSLLDPRPFPSSPVYQNYAATPAGLTPVNYRGAFGTNLWAAGWTALSEYGILAGAAPTTAKVTNIVSGQLTGTNNWYANQVYQLNGAAWVMSNAVLNIEAGTVVAGKNLGTGTNNVAALYITQGGKIYAQGTANNPIIFTAAIDDTTIPDDMPIWGPSARGQWGGLVILGQAPINGAIDTTGNAATPKYEVYEGLPDEVVGGQNVFRFGGTNDNDDSGILRYVSIRHGGAVLAPNKEINGLSLGAVGRGTTIEYVESYCAADDGFEFFGGTVNTKYLVSSFNDDDSFDTDMGYNGKNQFWFAIQAPDKRNYGMELNSQPNELINSNNAAPIEPRGTFQVYNLTVIGSGTASTNLNGGADDGIALRPFASPSIYNAIFTDFNGQGIRLDAQNNLSANNVVNSNYAAINNSLWWGFVTNAGTGSQAVDNSIANLSRGSSTAATFWNTAAFSNSIANPMLTSISRTNDGVSFLDPRPQTGSPALTSSTMPPNDGFYSQVAFKGAFDRTNLWIRGWTALDSYSMVTSSNPAPSITPTSPTILSAFGGGALTFSFSSESGVSYQLQATPVLNPAAWTNIGSALPGNGGTLAFPPVVSTNAQEFFRVLAQ